MAHLWLAVSALAGVLLVAVGLAIAWLLAYCD